MRRVVLLSLIASLLLSWIWALPVCAQGETPPGSGETEGAPSGLRGVFERITHVMEFPIESMTKALRLSVEHILAGTLEGLGGLYSDAMRAVAFGEYASGPSIDVVQPMWSRVMQVSAVLWPLTLALVVLVFLLSLRLRRGENAIAILALNEGEVQTRKYKDENGGVLTREVVLRPNTAGLKISKVVDGPAGQGYGLRKGAYGVFKVIAP